MNGKMTRCYVYYEENGKIYELMYAECLRIVCATQKEDDDRVKLLARNKQWDVLGP